MFEVDISLPLFYNNKCLKALYKYIIIIKKSPFVQRSFASFYPLCNPSLLYVFLSLFLCRDGPDQSSPQIGQFSGNTALESVYSTSNIILIKFHSDFSGAGFFVLSYHGKRVTTLSMLLQSQRPYKCTLYNIWGRHLIVFAQ